MLSITRAIRLYSAIVAATVGYHAMPAAADAPDSVGTVAGPLTLAQAVALSARYELRLGSAGLRADAARAKVPDAGRRPNPTISATEENFGGGLGSDRRETTVSAGQTFELGGDRGARRAAADAEHQIAVADVGVLAREARTLTADRFIDAWSIQARLRTLAEGARVSEAAIQAARTRHEAGAVPRWEVLRAESQASSEAIQRLRLESDLSIARQALALRWGAFDATFDTLVTPDSSTPLDTANVLSRLSNQPETKRAVAAEGLAHARLQAARAARTPDIALSGGLRRLEEVPGTGFVLGVESTLPLWSRNSGTISAASLELEAAAVERRATDLELRAQASAAIARFRSAAATFDALVSRIRPDRRQLVQELLAGYRAGRSSYLDLVAEQRNLLETELAVVDAQADLYRARVRLQLLLNTGPAGPQEDR